MKKIMILMTSVVFLLSAACSTSQQKSSKRDADNLKLLEQNVESTDSFFNHGKDHLVKNEFDKALESFSKSKYSQALFYKAIVLGQLGKPDEAQSAFRECVAKDILKNESNYNLAMISYDKGDAASAKELMEGVVSADPEHTGALFFLGNLKYLENDMDGALSYYEKALKTQPDSTDLWEAVFSVRLQKEEFSKAWEIREKLDRSNLETVQNVLKLAELTGNYLKGSEFVTDELMKDGNISKMTRILLTKGGKFENALKNAEKELESSAEGFVMIDRSTEAEGSYVIGVDRNSVFIVCSKDPQKFVPVTVSGGKVSIEGSKLQSGVSEISSLAKNFCLGNY
ncbi:MAG TPA: tetratricopeptide repeat protein [bacterium]|nr:tetratricopeptide repeat protein [bacterium]